MIRPPGPSAKGAGVSWRWANCCEREEECSRRTVRIDETACRTWIYPSNYPPREYQVAMVKAALLRNTLVCLPTGLGKTLIAAVLMYNYYRWFPEGQIIFMAPTKPLVSQQVEACHSVVGIPETETAELSGTTPSEVRRGIWQRKRVFYATPQTVENDLENNVLDAKRVVLVVVDEAHRAQKKHAYCVVVRSIARVQCHFRVLALSATPGTSLEGVQDVIDNLRVAHVEVRTEEDPDVAPHTHARLVEKVVCEQTSDLQRLSQLVCDMARPVLQRLENAGGLRSSDASVLTSFTVLQARQNNAGRGANFTDFLLGQKLVAIHDALKNYGPAGAAHKVRALEAEAGKTLDRLEAGETNVAHGDRVVAHFVAQDAAYAAARSALANASTEHPKTAKLRSILFDHFERSKAAGTSSRAMVFTGTRNSVSEIVAALKDCHSLRCVGFTGQGGMKQREQKAVVARFQANEFNVLVATCVAEEGLDIGSVDLCVCYDIVGSPVRLVQRMGRTGRKRTGRVILLVAPGEDRKFESGGRKSAVVIHSLRDASRAFQLRQALSKRMVPKSLVPQWPEMVQTKLAISEWHASQVAGIAKGGKESEVKTKARHILTVDDAVASWRLDDIATQVLTQRGWDRDWSYRPILGDGWRRRLRDREGPDRAPYVVVGDVTSTPSLRGGLLRRVADFVQLSMWTALYDQETLDLHDGEYWGLADYSDDESDGKPQETGNAVPDPWGWNTDDDARVHDAHVPRALRAVRTRDDDETPDPWGWNQPSQEEDRQCNDDSTAPRRLGCTLLAAEQPASRKRRKLELGSVASGHGELNQDGVWGDAHALTKPSAIRPCDETPDDEVLSSPVDAATTQTAPKSLRFMLARQPRPLSALWHASRSAKLVARDDPASRHHAPTPSQSTMLRYVTPHDADSALATKPIRGGQFKLPARVCPHGPMGLTQLSASQPAQAQVDSAIQHAPANQAERAPSPSPEQPLAASSQPAESTASGGVPVEHGNASTDASGGRNILKRTPSDQGWRERASRNRAEAMRKKSALKTPAQRSPQSSTQPSQGSVRPKDKGWRQPFRALCTSAAIQTPRPTFVSRNTPAHVLLPQSVLHLSSRPHCVPSTSHGTDGVRSCILEPVVWPQGSHLAANPKASFSPHHQPALPGACDMSVSSQTLVSRDITEEQRLRIERNKSRAKKLRAERESRTASLAAAVATNASLRHAP